MQCEVPGCTRRAVHRHHIFTRGAHRGDAEVVDNIFHCCLEHHEGSDSWHMTGRETFARKHGLEKRVECARRAVTHVHTPIGGNS